MSSASQNERSLILDFFNQDVFLQAHNHRSSPQCINNNQRDGQDMPNLPSTCTTAEPCVPCRSSLQICSRSVLSKTTKFSSTSTNKSSQIKFSSTALKQINTAPFQNQCQPGLLPAISPLPIKRFNQHLSNQIGNLSGGSFDSGLSDRADVPTSLIKRTDHPTKMHTVNSRKELFQKRNQTRQTF